MQSENRITEYLAEFREHTPEALYAELLPMLHQWVQLSRREANRIGEDLHQSDSATLKKSVDELMRYQAAMDEILTAAILYSQQQP